MYVQCEYREPPNHLRSSRPGIKIPLRERSCGEHDRHLVRRC